MRETANSEWSDLARYDDRRDKAPNTTSEKEPPGIFQRDLGALPPRTLEEYRR